MPWKRTATEVDESKRWQQPQTLGRTGQAIAGVELPTPVLGFAVSFKYAFLLGFAALLGSACATKPFNVKPGRVAPPGNFTARAAAGSIELQAAVIRDEDYLHSTFDANLILAGILPVKLALQNRGSGPADLKSMRVSLISGGHQQKPMEPRRAFKRLMGYYKIRVYSVDGYKASLADFVSYGFDQRVPLPPGESRWGLLFFESPAVQPPGSGLVLLVKGIGPAEFKLSVN